MLPFVEGQSSIRCCYTQRQTRAARGLVPCAATSTVVATDGYHHRASALLLVLLLLLMAATIVDKPQRQQHNNDVFMDLVIIRMVYI